MTELSYSLHLGSDKNKKNSSRASSKNNISNSTSKSNNAIQNANQLSRVDKHNYRKYDNDIRNIYIVKGSSSTYQDVQELYKTEFSEALEYYNNKQSRPSRMINDYFEHISNDSKKDLACEIIIELGNKEFWQSKDIEYKRKMINVFSKQVKDLENIEPNFKIASAVVHLDETSPHMHIVGIPIKNNCKTGLSKQVSKSEVFTKESLKFIQDNMRIMCIDAFNKEYNSNTKLKDKEKGRNFDIHVEDMMHYTEIKKELQNNKKSIDKNIEKINLINNSSKELNNLLNSLQESKLGGYRLNNAQKERLSNLLKDVENISEHFNNLSNVYTNISLINDNLNYQKENNKSLNEDYQYALNKCVKLEKKIEDLQDSEEFLKDVIKAKDKDHIELITNLCENVNSKDYSKSQSFKQVSNELYKKGIINKNERHVIFNPPRLINKSEIEKAISNINRQMEKEAEEFYNTNKNDYEL